MVRQASDSNFVASGNSVISTQVAQALVDTGHIMTSRLSGSHHRLSPTRYYDARRYGSGYNHHCKRKKPPSGDVLFGVIMYWAGHLDFSSSISVRRSVSGSCR